MGQTQPAPRQITAVVLRDFPPLYQLDAKGKPIGFAVDLFAEVARQAAWDVHYLVVENWAEALSALREKRADIVPAMGISTALEEEFLFSETVESIPVSCFVQSEHHDSTNCTDFKGLRVAVIRQGAAYQKLEQQPGINLIPTLNIETALFQLVNGSVDVFIAPQPVVLSKAASIGMGQTITIVGQPLMQLQRGMMVRKEMAALLSAVNTIVRDITHSSFYLEKMQYWYGQSAVPSRPNRHFMWLAWFFLLLAGGAWLFLWLKKRRVRLMSVSNGVDERDGWSFSSFSLAWFHNKVTGWIVLFVSIVLTILAWHISNVFMEKRNQDRFDFKVEEARLAIYKRMREYEQVLRGGVGLFNASDEVTRQDWHKYVSTLQIDTYWPGIQGIGFSLMIAPEEKEAVIEYVRAEGFPAFVIRPEGERPQYSTIIYLEPFSGRNLRAFGYDMFSETVRHAAMEQARDSGLPALSGRVTLVQETNQDVQVGFLMYLPVYKPLMPVTTIQERREALLGFVYSPFRMRDLMEGILGYGVPDLDFELFDGAEINSEYLLYSTRPQDERVSNQPARYIKTSLLDLPGRTWRVRFVSRQSFEQEMETSQSLIVACLGMLVDLLLFAIVWSLSGQKDRIQRQARTIAMELNQADVRYRRMVDNVKDVIFQMDLSGHWRFLNPAWEEISGHTVRDSLGRPFISYLHPEDTLRVEAQFQKLVNGGQSVLRDAFSGLHASGKRVWVEVYAVAQTGEDGQVEGLSGTLRDITLQKQFEEVMVQARDAAESANRAKSEFLANMSHELRTPLNSLLILSRLLTQATNLTPEQIESAQVIHDSGTDLLHLINDILDLSKVEAGHVDVMPEKLFFEDFLEDIRDQFLPVAHNKGLFLDLSLAENLPPVMITDKVKLEQILRNLLANAFRFTQSGGVSVHVDRQEERFAFSVTDTGMGIPSDKQELIFETFRQVDGATSRQYGGTGLGLSISRKLAHLLHGVIDIKSQEGVGSTFTLVLPSWDPRALEIPESYKDPLSVEFHAPWTILQVTEGDDVRQNVSGALRVNGRPVTLLVVDDDMRAAYSVTRALHGRVENVLVAANGQMALQELESHPEVDVVLMDIRMPNMDGYETMRRIRADSRFAQIGLVALTALAMPDDREKCLQAGADGYLTKPVKMETLWHQLEEILARQEVRERSEVMK